MKRRRLRCALVLALFVDVGAAAAYLDQAGPGLLRYVEARFGPPAPPRIVRWERERVPADPEQVLLASVNRKANGVPAVADSEHWQQPDYWATPVEFVASNGGDCEDFAIAKYFALREAGVPGERLRMTYVRALTAGRIENHMVLAYYASPGADPLILDNLNPRVLPASERADLVAVFSFNDDDLRRGQLPMLRRWHDLQQRMQAEREL
jgi:predicted transglutaminase-like cysteine proteinase